VRSEGKCRGQFTFFRRKAETIEGSRGRKKANCPLRQARASPCSPNRAAARLCLAGLSLFGLTSQALAHASDRGYVLLLPTGHYMVAGAAAVAVSFLALALLPSGALPRLAAASASLFRLPDGLRPFTSLAAFAVLVLLVAAGFLGERDPLENP